MAVYTGYLDRLQNEPFSDEFLAWLESPDVEEIKQARSLDAIPQEDLSI